MVTEISWGDGTSDKIYLTYTAASGNQTVLVSSDANAGPARTKNIVFTSTVGSITRVLTVTQDTNMDYVSITWNDTCITFNDTGIAYPYTEEYIVFEDPVVEAICATNWGDGTGIKPSEAIAVTNSMFGTTFKGNDEITSFDELKYFTGLTAFTQASNQGAFYNCISLKSIYTPPSVHNLIGGTFRNCSSLEEIHFGGYISQGNNAYVFSGCSSLTKCYFENSSDLWGSGFYTSINSTYCYQPFIGSGSGHYYIGDNELTSVVVPKELSAINAGLFVNCTYITSLSFEAPSTCATIYDFAFYGCSGIVGTVTIPSSVTNIRQGAFQGCSGLTSVALPQSGLTTIGNNAFRSCSSLTGSVTLPSSVTTIGTYMFYGTGISSLTIPASVTSYSGRLCDEMQSLEELHFYASLPHNTNSNFYNCVSLVKLYATDFEQYQTLMPNQLTHVSNSDVFSNNTGTHYVYFNDVEVRDLVIPNTVTRIRPGACRRWNRLTSVTIPNSVIEIGGLAFQDCVGLTGNLNLREVTLGGNAFNGCTGLTDVTMDGFDVGSGQFTFPFSGAGDGTGTLTVYGSVINGYAGNANNKWGRFKHVLIKGDWITYSNYESNSGPHETIIIEGNFVNNGNGPLYNDRDQSGRLKFLELWGTFNKALVYDTADPSTDTIVHFKYNGIAGTAANAKASFSEMTKFYVGDGSSQAADQAVLDLYLADTDWAAYSSKLDLWYNYSGPYKV